MSRTVVLAAVIAAHGLKGELRVKLFTNAPDGLTRYGALSTGDGRMLTVSSVRPLKNGEAVIAFAEVVDRAQAEQLKGTGLSVGRDAFPVLDEQEFYHADLIGLRAEDQEGRVIGHVRSIHNYGAGDVIELERSDGDNVLLAFTRENVPTIEVKNGRIVVAVPEDSDADTRGNVQ